MMIVPPVMRQPRARIGHRGEADGRLAGAGFADQAEDLAALQVDVDIVDEHRPVAGRRSALRRAASNIEDDRIVCCRRRALRMFAHAPSPWPREWIDSSQSTTRLTPIVRIAMAAAG